MNEVNTYYAIVTGSYLLYSGTNQIVTALNKNAVTKINDSIYSVPMPTDYFVKLGEIVGIVPLTGSILKCWPENNGEYITKYTTPTHETTLTIG
jgi:hypothetical protein